METTQIIILSLITISIFVKTIVIKGLLKDDYVFKFEGLFIWIYQSLMLNAIALLLMYMF